MTQLTPEIAESAGFEMVGNKLYINHPTHILFLDDGRIRCYLNDERGRPLKNFMVQYVEDIPNHETIFNLCQ